MQKETVLVVGGAGYRGSHIAFLLANQGYTVILLDNNYPTSSDQFPWAITIQGDYGNPDLLNILFTEYAVDIVIHCATLTIDATLTIAENNKLLTIYEHDINKTVTLLKLMVDHQVKKIIFSSSSTIYDPLAKGPINENNTKNPSSIQGKTKLLLEAILQDVQKSCGLQYIILRYFNISGAYPEHMLGTIKNPASDLISFILESAYQHKPLHIFSEQHALQAIKPQKVIRDFVHVRDVADANLKACLHLGRELPSDIFNIGSGLSYSLAQIIEVVQKVTDIKIDIKDQQALLFNAWPLVADIHRAHDILNWNPIYSSLDFIIASLYQLHKKSPHFL